MRLPVLREAHQQGFAFANLARREERGKCWRNEERRGLFRREKLRRRGQCAGGFERGFQRMKKTDALRKPRLTDLLLQHGGFAFFGQSRDVQGALGQDRRLLARHEGFDARRFKCHTAQGGITEDARARENAGT